MTTRTPLMAGNWKMNLNHLEAIAHVQKLAFALADKDYDAVEVAVLAPFTDLRSVQTLVDGDKLKIKYGAQDISAHDGGAYTGEISGPMLAKLKCTYVAVGHSERRQYHAETDEIVNAKVKAAYKHGLTPILCVGEELDVREAGNHVEHTLAQVEGGLKDLAAEQAESVVIAYEPVWAIGKGLRRRRRPGGLRGDPRQARRAVLPGAGRQGPHPVRRLRQVRQRRRDHGQARHRRRPGRRRLAGLGRVRQDRPLPRPVAGARSRGRSTSEYALAAIRRTLAGAWWPAVTVPPSFTVVHPNPRKLVQPWFWGSRSP